MRYKLRSCLRLRGTVSNSADSRFGICAVVLTNIVVLIGPCPRGTADELFPFGVVGLNILSVLARTNRSTL